jgi:peptidoglycan/LPS O-acetylase OafA/YrhL
MRRTIVATLLGALALASAILAVVVLSALWFGPHDSPDSTYVLIAIPLAAVAIGAAARLFSLFPTHRRTPLMVVSAVALGTAFVGGVVGAVTIDVSHVLIAVSVGVLGIACFGIELWEMAVRRRQSGAALGHRR